MHRDVLFVTIWQTSKTVGEAVRRCKATRKLVLTKAAYLRRCGVALKYMSKRHADTNMDEDIDAYALNQLIEKLSAA